MNINNRSSSDWEIYVGEKLRTLRIDNSLDQQELASKANISVGAIKNLEGGKGSSLKTLLLVLRALDSLAWLESLAPKPVISPLQMYRDMKLNGVRQRVSRKRLNV